MYLIQRSVFVVLLLHQCIVDGFNFFNKDFGVNYLNREINSRTSSVGLKAETRWMFQKLDHFNSSDKRMWEMKYLEGLKYWRENGPIYIFLGPPGSVDRYATLGIMDELAQETYGAMYILEYRYYGDSKPFTNLDAENMKYLNSKQILADISQLIINLKTKPMYKDSKVVVTGGFYGGNLAVWMKVLYPTLVDAVISSSAPLLAQKDFYEALEKVKDNYNKYGGTDCLKRIKIKYYNYDSLLQSPEGMKQFKKDEQICDSCDMTNIENQQFFFWIRTYVFLYAYTNPMFIKFHCDNLDIITDYRSFLNEPLEVINSEHKMCSCYDFNKRMKQLKELRNFNDLYPWLYQECTELGYFQTTSSKNQPFLNIPLEFYIRTCRVLFGNNFNEKSLDERIENSIKLYGGLKPNVTKVVFTNGELDPWSTISVLEDLSHDAQAVVIPRASHINDLLTDTFTRNKVLKEAQRVVKYLIKKWIGAYV